MTRWTGAAGDLDTVRERLLDGVHRAAEGWQQGRMSIQHPPAVGGDKLRDEDFVEAGQHDEADSFGLQRLQQGGLPLGAARVGGAICQADWHTG